MDVSSPAALLSGEVKVLVFPGVGAFGCAIDFLDTTGYRAALLEYIRSGKHYMGICLGLQTLFEGSEESPGVPGLGLIPGVVRRFAPSDEYSVPHIGWNGISLHQDAPALTEVRDDSRVYFVHSYRATPTPSNEEWVATSTDYGDGQFISSVRRGNVFATQFHPEKSGALGLSIFKGFLASAIASASGLTHPTVAMGASVGPVFGATRPKTLVSRRIIA